MFAYETVASVTQTELYTEGCRDYVKVLCTDEKDRKLLENWEPEPCLLTEKYKKFAEKIRSFQVFDDDVWIITYPKCGTTWTQEMVWLLINGLDFKPARDTDINQRSPYLEISAIGSNIPFDSVANIASQVPRPRIIKSHLPLNLLPRQLFTVKPRILYVTRNPKDTAISYFHHYAMLLGYRGNLNTFLNAFLTGDLIYGSYYTHMAEFLALAACHKNIFIIKFEDMKLDMESVLKRVSAFLCRATSYSSHDMQLLKDHLDFERMKCNEACNNERMTRNAMDMNGRKGEQFQFLRKGQIGTYKDEMTSVFIDKFNVKWSQQPPPMVTTFPGY